MDVATILTRTLLIVGVVAFIAGCSTPRPVPVSTPAPAPVPAKILPVCPEHPVDYQCRKMTAGEIGIGPRGNNTGTQP